MKKALVVMGLLIGLVAVAGVAAYALFFPSPREQCRVVARRTWAATDSAALHHPMGLSWRAGLLYVADTEHGAVKLYTADGTLVAVWTGFARPIAVAPTESLVYVVDFLTDRVSALANSGRPVRSWGRQGKGAGEFDGPSGVAVDQQGNVYVTDLYNHRVQKFTGDGRFLHEWGGRGRGSGSFRYPTGVAIAQTGEVLVADGFNHRVQRFTSDGRYIDKFGGTGMGLPGRWPGWFALAREVALDAAGNLYVADAFNGRVQTFTPDGRLRAVWSFPRGRHAAAGYASGLAVDQQGHAYVSDFFRSEIWEITCPTSERARNMRGWR